MTETRLEIMYPSEAGRPDLARLGAKFNTEKRQYAQSINEYDEFDLDYHSAPAIMEAAIFAIPAGAVSIAALRTLRDVLLAYLKGKETFVIVRKDGQDFLLQGHMSKRQKNDILDGLTKSLDK